MQNVVNRTSTSQIQQRLTRTITFIAVKWQQKTFPTNESQTKCRDKWDVSCKKSCISAKNEKIKKYRFIDADQLEKLACIL